MNAKYIATVTIHDGGDWQTKYVYASPRADNPALSDDRKHATEFVSVNEAQAQANLAIRNYAEDGRFQQHQADARVLPAAA